MARYLDYYSKPDANGDHIVLGLTDLESMTGTMAASDAELQSAAIAAGDSTWNEDTICAVYGLTRKPAPVRLDGEQPIDGEQPTG